MLASGVPYTADDLSAIDAVIAQGELSVQFADRRVTYRSIHELKEAKADILRDLASSSGTTRKKQAIGVACKGL